MLADKTGVERGQAWLVKSSFCQKATYRRTRAHTQSHQHHRKRSMAAERQKTERQRKATHA